MSKPSPDINLSTISQKTPSSRKSVSQHSEHISKVDKKAPEEAITQRIRTYTILILTSYPLYTFLVYCLVHNSQLQHHLAITNHSATAITLKLVLATLLIPIPRFASKDNNSTHLAAAYAPVLGSLLAALIDLPSSHRLQLSVAFSFALECVLFHCLPDTYFTDEHRAQGRKSGPLSDVWGPMIFASCALVFPYVVAYIELVGKVDEVDVWCEATLTAGATLFPVAFFTMFVDRLYHEWKERRRGANGVIL